ncbi:MAG: PIG-L family deacetylase [Bacteroidetes bacterium]|nr:PIG-L family deacetylase [Bacteroidota bacterium]
MKREIKALIAVFVVIALIIAGNFFYLIRIKGDEKFPEEKYLGTVTNKTALIVVAHDDDAIFHSGTILNLTNNGWKVHFLTFYGHWRREDNSLRKQEAATAAALEKLAGYSLIDFSIQKTDTVKEPWMPIPYAKFSEYLKVDSLKILIANEISRIQPSIMFTLDNISGAYGHPEHACVSQCVINVCNEMKNDSSFSVNKIYQSVYSRQLSENLMSEMPVYKAAKKVYHVDGMPTPDVEVNIYDHAATKMKIWQAYESQERNIKKVAPFYKWYPAWIYFWIFDKEYFKVIDVKE